MSKKILLCILLFPLLAQAQTPIRIATVGNSITYGAGVRNCNENSYPAQLQTALGTNYQVNNFAIGAHTLLALGDRPYRKTKEFQASLNYKPNIVLIKLGTINAGNFNKVKFDSTYKKNYQSLINSYKALASKPRIILMTPIRCYLQQGPFAGADTAYQKHIIPAIKQLAFENDLELIDLYPIFRAKFNAYLMPDSLHPSESGAARIVERIAPIIACSPRKDSLAEGVVAIKSNISNFHAYKMYDWGGGYKIVVPRVAPKGASQWVARTSFWGHKPEVDIALLERGFHIAYCPAENLFGSPKAVQMFDDFYARMMAAGFAPKVVLEAISYGALAVYNWAAQNPEKVAAIYADAPVMNLKNLHRNCNLATTQTLMNAYQFRNKRELREWQKTPINHARILQHLPIIHLVGQMDTISVADNTALFKDSIQKAGGKMTLVNRESYNAHTLDAPNSVINFILTATQQVNNTCVVPVPGHEWRQGIGWRAGTDWWAQNEEIANLTQDSCQILLLGNSITQGLGGDRKKIVKHNGISPLTKALGDTVRWINAGISGDKIENLLWRMRNNNYEAANPQHVFISIGVNNCNDESSTEEIAEGILLIVQQARAQFAEAKITLFGMLPYKRIASSNALRKILKEAALPDGVEFVDASEWFTQRRERLNLDYYAKDLIHLSPKGYEMWSKKIADIYFRNR
ncbi:MAG: GDSL-type esterase/lipase family protein [Bacteroidales bacterium]